MVALQALHESRRHLARQEGIFSPCLLPAPPTRIAENIHIRRPEVKPLVLIGITIPTQCGMIFGTSFIANSGGDLMNQFLIPSCGHANCLREDGGAPIATD